MTADAADRYSKFVAKLEVTHKQRKNRPLAMTRGLLDFLGNFKKIAGALELEGLTKAQVIGFSACMGNLKVSESKLGLFSDPFIDIAEMIAKQIAGLTNKNGSQSAKKLIQWWLEVSIIITVGLLELVHEKKTTKETQDLDPVFRDELVLSLLFHTNFPKLVFKEMGEALQIAEARNETFVCLFEAIIIIFALVSYSSLEETINKGLGETLQHKLKEDISHLLKNLDESEIKPYLELAEMALEKGEIDQLALTFQDLIKSAGYSIDLLIKDISAMKGLFKRLKTAYYASQENSTNMVHMIG